MTQPPSLLEAVRNKIRVKHYSIRTEKYYIQWIKSYLHFHSMQHCFSKLIPPANKHSPQKSTPEMQQP